MKRLTLNRIVDVLAFVSFLFMASTGLILEFLLPPRSGQRLSVMSLTRHEWGEIHLLLAYGFLAVTAVHLVLHWGFVKQLIRGESHDASGFRFALGLMCTSLLLLAAALPFLVGVEHHGR